MKVRAVLLVLVLFTTGACASTNHQDAEFFAGATDAPANEVAGSSAAPASAEPGTSATVATTGGDGPQGGPNASSVPAGTTAVTDTSPIRLGFITIDLQGAEVLLSGLGTQVSFGDGEKQAQVVVDELNSTGGIGGRKILPFYAKVNVTGDSEGNYIAACEQLTSDSHVFAILTPLNVTASFVACAAKHGVPVINVSFNPGDDELFRLHKDWFFSPALMSLDRGSKLMLQQLRSDGGLGAGQKVGLVTLDEIQTRRVSDRTVKPLLRGWKVPFVEAVVKSDSDVSGAVLRFRTNNVTRVIFEAPSGIGQVLFMNQAQNQGFHPKYSFWDPDSPRFVSETAPEAQVRNITGIGALPISDVPPSEFAPQAAERRCIDTLNKRGYQTRNRNSNLSAVLYCEATWVFAAAAKRVKGPMTATAWRTAYHQLGTSYAPISTFHVDMSTGRNDNSTHYRKLSYVLSCHCMRFSGPSMKAP